MAGSMVSGMASDSCVLCAYRCLRLDTGAPSGYLDPYLQVFSDKNPYLDLQGSFPTVHLDPQVFYLQVTGQQVLKVPTGIQ
jgi:hypothetical protein